MNAIGMQSRQWDYTVFNDAEEETEVTKLIQNNFFFFYSVHVRTSGFRNLQLSELEPAENK